MYVIDKIDEVNRIDETHEVDEMDTTDALKGAVKEGRTA